MDLHLDAGERQQGNRRNGQVSKQVRTSDGIIEVESSRDRSASFEPQIIRKRETVLAENLEPRILSMYGLGMSLRDISSHLKEVYDMDISHDTLAALTEKIVP
ncbi:transposase [Pontibacter sp. E15-1]|nr:transposase [Pontibacter sp. E15-1]MCJ8165667.1 transposase [Pontibacter sp. E15-1]